VGELVISVRGGWRLAALAALIPLGAGCNAILGVDNHSLKPGAGGMTGTGGAAGTTSSCTVDGGVTDADASDASTAMPCGFVVPNFGSGLPNQANYAPPGLDQSLKDNITTLTWQGLVDNRTVSQPEAASFCDDQDKTYGPWRLPTMKELMSLVDFTVPPPGPTISAMFPDRPAEHFWTSSPAACGPKYWYVDFAKGDAHQELPNVLKRIRCVRGALPNCVSTRYSIPGDGTVHDATTGLTWSQTVTGSQNLTWSGATAYCPTLGTGWRLPSPTELETLIDLTKQGPPIAPIDQAAFPNTPSDNFWAYPTQANDPSVAWYVAFVHGHIDVVDVTLPYWARCVRWDGL